MDVPRQLETALSGRYVIERELGRGGMATVYLARDLRHDRHVALKVLDPELGAVLGAERFLSEIRVTANLQHPHLLPLFDSGMAEGLLFYVMPYVDGESLRQRIEREKQLPVEEAVRIAAAVASALDYAHKRAVIHRDLKPENILMQAGQPIVADFGIALAVSAAGGARVTQTGLSLGTPQYMSPEQATGDRVIDGRSDIYSLGAVLYEMLTGEPPHTGHTMQAIIARVLTEQPRDVRSVRPNVPEHVAIAIERALEKIPADRWATAHEFAAALEGKSVAVSAHGATSSPGMRDGRRRPTWGARVRDPLIMALGLTTIGAAIFGVRGWSAGRQLDTRPVVRFSAALPKGVGLISSNQQSVAVAPFGGMLAFVGRRANGAQMIYTRTLDDDQPKPVPGTEGAFTLFFSPDGKWIGFVVGNRVRKVKIDGSSVLPVAETPGIYGGASWGPHGQMVISMDNSGLFLVDENGGTPARLCRDLTGDAQAAVSRNVPLVLPDGETVLYSSWTAQSINTARLAMASIRTGKCEVLDVAGIQPLGLEDGILVYVTAAGAVMGLPFDLSTRRASGTPEPLITDVDVNQATGAAQVALSRDGALVYQNGSLPMRMVSVDERGTSRPVIEATQQYLYPRLSPDGRKIAVAITSSAQRDVWVYDIASGTPTRLTSDGTLNDRPEWSPDGKRVLFRTARGKRSNLWWRMADLSAPEEPLLLTEAADIYEGVLAPDGERLVYQLDTAGADIFYRRLHGDTAQRSVATTPFLESMARVSPDGGRLAYVSTESGAEQVVVQPFPGPGARMQVSIGGGTEPVWARDGRRLFYRDNGHIVATTFDTKPPFAVVKRDTLFDDMFVQRSLPHANFDVFPDGAHFLFVQATEEAKVIVVHNWTAELKARMRGKRKS